MNSLSNENLMEITVNSIASLPILAEEFEYILHKKDD